MRGHIRKLAVLAMAFVCLAVLSVSAHAKNLNVYCGGKRLPNTINGALKLLDPQGPNTLTVFGTCNENVVITSFDNLTLQTVQATTGASINDASGGTAAVIGIQDSTRITIQGFTINGGLDGIDCVRASVCYLRGNTIQSSLGQQGVLVGGGSRGILNGNTIQNNTQRGLTVNQGGQVFSNSDTFSGNTSAAIVANSGTYFTANSSSITNNGTDTSAAIVVSDHSAARLISCTISGNKGDGVDVGHASEARFDSYSGPITVTANAGVGVLVADLSFALFSGGGTITGNLAGADVLCIPQFPATRGALTNIGGGVTNCVEP